MPYLRYGDWNSRKDAFSEVVINTLSQYAPKLKDSIVNGSISSPAEFESTYALPEGNVNHGEMTLGRFFHMRPIPGYARYRTPVQGLYLSG
jgi:phytoene dehydrogenase-like protein